ncbi:MAG: uracil-DNA glycosylase, partial [Microvirga sp.]|nr:uracil-DNA glycosylase [Microvirga sp.]
MQDQPLDRDTLHAILDFHVEAGVDIALDEVPHNRFTEAAAPAARNPEPA